MKLLMLISAILAHLLIVTARPAPETSSRAIIFPRADTSWQQYVRAPASNNVSPVRVLNQYTTGSVTNSNGLLSTTNSSGDTVLTRNGPGDAVPSLVLDFGQNYAGLVSIAFSGSKLASGSKDPATARPGISLAFSETLEALSNRSDFTRSDNAPGPPGGVKLTNGTDQIAVLDQKYTWTDQPGCQYGAQVCADGLHGFRYLKIILQALPEDYPYTTAYGSVSISAVSLTYSGYLGTPDTYTGYFECSDTDINQWWYDGVYTNDLCTDVFRSNDTEPRYAGSSTLIGKLVIHDGAKRDRDPYVGDLAVSGLTSYMSHNVAVASRNVLADLADHQRDDGWIPPASINYYTLPLFDYPLWWVVGSSNLVLYTGDVPYLNQYYSNLILVLDTFYPSATNQSNGLLQKGLGVTGGYGDYAFLPRSGIITYYNALYMLALNKAADLADIQGQPKDAARWRARAVQIGPALMKENFDASVNAFYDGGPCPGGPGTSKCDVHAQDGNSLAILSGVTQNDTSIDEGILAYMQKSLARPYGNAFYDNSILSPGDQFDQRVYGFISYFEIAARFQVNSTVASAFDQLRRMYGWMANHDPYSTFWEGIGPGGGLYEGGFTSMAHGWATGIVPLMQNYVLGVMPTGPGFATWEVNPVVDGGGLAWARGAVPTPKGPLNVSWAFEASSSGAGGGSVLTLQVSAPAGTSGVIGVPLLGGQVMGLERDGRRIWSRSGSQSVNENDSEDEGEGSVVRDGRVLVKVEGGGRPVVLQTF